MTDKCNHVPDDLLCQAMGEKGKCPGHPWQDLGNHAAVSAYSLAVANGFRGTVQEWLDSLIGPRGERGEAFTYEMFTPEQLEGLIGPQGPQGPIGPEGAPFTYDMFTEEQLAALVGPTGPQGIQGSTALQRWPVASGYVNAMLQVHVITSMAIKGILIIQTAVLQHLILVKG